MEDTVTDIEQDVQTEQEPTPKLKVKEFAAKIKAKYPEYKDIDDKELTDKIVAKYPEYKDQIDFSVEVKKKEVGSNGLPTPSGNGLSGTPKDEVVIKAEPIKPTEPIEASLQADELSKRTKKQYVAGGELGSTEIIVPDEEAKKEAQLLRDEIKVKYGYDADELASEHKGLKPSDYGREGFGKEELLIDKNENPQLYQRKLGRLKWQSGFESVLADNLVNGHITSEEYNGINNAIQSSLENASVGDYVQQRENINYVANAIKQYGGLDKDKILKDYAVEVGKVYGNSYKSLSAQKKQETPESKFLNPDAELGLQYLRDIDPEKAKQYDRLFVDPKKLEGDALKGYNHLMQTLEETSIGLQDNAVTEDLNNLSNIAKRNNGLTPEQLEQAKILEAKKDEIEKKKLELDQKYPDRIEDKIDDAVQEVLGQRLGWGNYAGGMTGKAIKNTAQGIWESVSEPFMSDASNSMRELAIMGESLGESKLYNKTDANKSFQTDQLIFKPELQAEVDLIKNDKSLTREQKEAKLYPLLKENKDDFGRVPIQGGKFNVSPSSILYGVTDIGTTLLPFIGLEALTGGIGGAGTAARFLRTFTAAAATSFHDEYANAISEGKPQSEAYKQAMGMTAITSAGMAGAGTAEKVRAFYGSSKSSASKIIKGMSDDQIEYVLDAAKLPKVLKPFLSIGERGIATPKMFAKGAKTGAEFELAMGLANEAKHQIYDTPIDREQNFKQSLLGIANFGLLGAGLGHIGYKSPTELQKSGFSEMGKNPEEFHLAAKQMLKDGQLTKQEFDHRTLLIDKSAEAQKTLPKANAKGKPLSEKEQSDYIYNSVIKNEGKKAASNLPPVQAEKAEHTALVADFKNDLILEPKTDAQLESRENALEKVLEPKKDADGKTIELNEKVEKEAKAELQAINEVIQEQKQEEQPQPEVIEPSTEVKKVKDIIEALDKVEKDNPSKINELNNLGFDFTDNKSIAEAYHEAKLLVDDVRDAEQRKLVKAIEETILPKSEPKPTQQPSEVKSEVLKDVESTAKAIESNPDVVNKVLDSQKDKTGDSFVYIPNTEIINEIKKANVGDEIIVNVPVDKYLYGHDSEPFPSTKHDDGFNPTSKREIKEPIRLNVESLENPFLEATDGNTRIVQARFNKDKTIPARIEVDKDLKEQADNFDSNKSLAEAYHKAKKDGTNPELVKAVEEALAPKLPIKEGEAKQQPSEVKGEEIKPSTIEDVLNPNHKGFGERMEAASKTGGSELTKQHFEEDKNVNYVFRNASKEEVDNVLSGEEKTGDFWRSEPNQYKSYGDYVIVKKVPDLKQYSRNYSKASKIEEDGFNYVGEKVGKEDIDFIYNKKTGEIIYNNNPELVKSVEEALTPKSEPQPSTVKSEEVKETPSENDPKLKGVIDDVNDNVLKLHNVLSKRQFAKEFEFDGVPKEGAERIKYLKYRNEYLDAVMTKLDLHEDAGKKDQWFDLMERVEDEYDANIAELKEAGEIKSENKPIQQNEEVKSVKNSDGTITVQHGNGIIELRDEKHAESYSKKAGITLKFVDKLDVPKEEVKSEKQSVQHDNTLQSSIDKFDNVENYTIEDLVNDAEGIAETTGNKKISDAIEEYRNEQEENRKLKGRGDMETANDKIEKIIREESKSETTPEIKKLETERDNKIKELEKVEVPEMEFAEKLPEIEVEVTRKGKVIGKKMIVDPELIKKNEVLKDRFKKLKEIIECLSHH